MTDVILFLLPLEHVQIYVTSLLNVFLNMGYSYI